MFGAAIIVFTVLAAVHWLVSAWVTDLASRAFEELYDSVQRKGIETETPAENYQDFLGILTIFTCAAPLYMAGIIPVRVKFEMVSSDEVGEDSPLVLWMGPYVHAACLWVHLLSFLRFPLAPKGWISGINASVRLWLNRDDDGGMKMVPRPSELAVESLHMRNKAELIQGSRKFEELLSSAAIVH